MISVIVTTYNRSFYLAKCLESLAKQTAPSSEYEVIIVDNNCTDNTKELVQNFIAEHPGLNFKYILETKQGLTNARNRGIDESKGTIVAFVDDDAMAHPKYCSSLMDGEQKYSEYHAFGGKIHPVFPDGKEPAWLSTYVWGIVAKVDLGDKIIAFNKKFPAGCNMAFRKDKLVEIGLFNTDVNFRSDDRDIFNRLRAAGYKVLYIPEMEVDHNIPDERASINGIRRIAILSGIGERNRLKGSLPGLIGKFINYSVKIVAAIILSLGFILKGEKQKALIIKIMFWSLQGFVFKEDKILYNR